MTIQLSRYIGGLFSYYTQIWEGIFTPFQRDYFKSPIWPHAGGEKILLLYGDFFAVFICICRNFLRFSNLFSLSGKMASYYTDKKQAFFEGVFRKVYKLFKNAPSPESDPPTIRRKTRCFYGNFAKVFSFSPLCLPSENRSSYYTQKKQAFCVGVFQNVYKKFKNTPSPETLPTIRIKDKRFGKVLFGKKRKASHLFPLRRAICTPSLFFPDEVQIDLLLYAQKTGILIAYPTIKTAHRKFLSCALQWYSILQTDIYDARGKLAYALVLFTTARYRGSRAFPRSRADTGTRMPEFAAILFRISCCVRRNHWHSWLRLSRQTPPRTIR